MTDNNRLRVLAVGDTVGKPGRRACMDLIPKIREREQIDFIIINGENIAGGSSITKETVDELFKAGADVVTTGDHIFKKKEATPLLATNERILRPHNYPAGTPGSGMVVVKAKNGTSVAVINLMGRVFMQSLDCPFQSAEKALAAISRETPIILVDFHAEATSEKVALGRFLDGKVSAVFGTHTHVQTADETILPHGTAYITDLGMCGPHDSVIGRKVEVVLKLFLTQMPTHLDVASGDERVSGIILDIDASSGRALSIKRIHEKLKSAN